MPGRRKPPKGGGGRDDIQSETPARQDEAEILKEANAEQSEDGQLLVDEDTVKEIGAVDTASVRANRRMEDAVNKKKANVKNVSFTTDDLLEKYDYVLKQWPANTLDIHVRRVTGTPVARPILTRPRSGTELYKALETIHGQSEEAEYEVKIQEISTKQYRAIGRIVMPDARPPQQAGQPMGPYYPPGYPPGYPAPPGYSQQPPPYGMPPQGAPVAPAPVPAPVAAPPAPMAPPPPAPAAPDMGSMVDQVRQLWQLIQSMQPAPLPPVMMPPPVYMPPPPPMPAMPPPPAPGADLGTVLEWMRQFQEMQLTMQAQQQPPPPPYQPPPPPVPAPNPYAPPIDVPPGTHYVHGIGLVSQKKLFRMLAQDDDDREREREREREHHDRDDRGRDDRGGRNERGDRSQAAGQPRYRPNPMYRDQSAPPRYQEDDQQQQYRPQQSRFAQQEGQRFERQQPEPTFKNPLDQFRESITVVKQMRNMVQEMEGYMPDNRGSRDDDEPAPVAAGGEDEDNPVRIVNVGDSKILMNKSDNKLRLFDTLVANGDKIFKSATEMMDKINKQNQEARRQQQQEQPQQLGPGYVEVHPGYRPPPGSVAILPNGQRITHEGLVVDPPSVPPPPRQEFRPEPPPQEEPLPPPPPAENLPPPVSNARRAWDAPIAFDKN